MAARRPVVESRDLFLVYVPEDRLPVAGPLGVELIKRRVSVALDYEVVTGPQLSAALEHGLEHHRAGVVLRTRAFERVEWGFEVQESDRLRVISARDAEVTAAELAELDASTTSCQNSGQLTLPREWRCLREIHFGRFRQHKFRHFTCSESGHLRLDVRELCK